MSLFYHQDSALKLDLVPEKQYSYHIEPILSHHCYRLDKEGNVTINVNATTALRLLQYQTQEVRRDKADTTNKQHAQKHVIDHLVESQLTVVQVLSKLGQKTCLTHSASLARACILVRRLLVVCLVLCRNANEDNKISTAEG